MFPLLHQMVSLFPSILFACNKLIVAHNIADSIDDLNFPENIIMSTPTGVEKSSLSFPNYGKVQVLRQRPVLYVPKTIRNRTKWTDEETAKLLDGAEMFKDFLRSGPFYAKIHGRFFADSRRTKQDLRDKLVNIWKGMAKRGVSPKEMGLISLFQRKL